LYRITFVLNLFKGEHDRELSHASLKTLLMALMHLDVLYLKAHPETPALFSKKSNGEPFVRYAEEPPGQEDWQDVPTTMKLGWGDCLPLDTLVLREDRTPVEMRHLKIGDRLVGDGGISTVLEACITHEKPILVLDMDNGNVLRCSADHKSFMADDTLLRASQMRVGMRLKTPPQADGREPSTQIVAIREEPSELVCDIRTDTGRFYLPESDVITSNCEDLACWRAAELRVRHDVQAEPTFIWKLRANGGYLYHILVKYPDGRIEDPSRTLGMR
jgi:hypothetical protein